MGALAHSCNCEESRPPAEVTHTWATGESEGAASRASLMLSSRLACLASSTPSVERTIRLKTLMPAAVAASVRDFICKSVTMCAGALEAHAETHPEAGRRRKHTRPCVPPPEGPSAGRP
jgi:hypothetical protein